MKAICLNSGGLDSLLALKLIHSQGIECISLTFHTIFLSSSNNKQKHYAIELAKELNVKFMFIDISKEYLEIIKKPVYGFGSGANPCIDCKILFLRKAREIMEKEKANFVVTGEVLGQRPMTQFLKSLNLIEKKAELKGLIVRPLSAKFLPLTIPEQQGWINRELLCNIQGRSRKIQFELAEKFGIENYSTPAGGCLLTDESFSKKVKDLLKYKLNANLSEFVLLKKGRHFRLSNEYKLISGRNHKENIYLKSYAEKNNLPILKARDVVGSLGILDNDLFNDEIIKLAARIVLRYSDNSENEGNIIVIKNNEIIKEIKVEKLSDEEISKYRV
ncbi:MAG TPA: 7-cyano-7-deazaguanine synthase [bacterium]|nr:7-cyano-7-deazaguanine synthase [bacterium]HOL47509.1 7-cyano-7-deazaguanine synthase [bacterium]HPQ18815.1 7-cyano-7-deazaguanine synthase [bacterium]